MADAAADPYQGSYTYAGPHGRGRGRGRGRGGHRQGEEGMSQPNGEAALV